MGNLKQIEVELKNEISTESGGTTAERGVVVLTAPSAKNRVEVGKLKRWFSAAIEEANRSALEFRLKCGIKDEDIEKAADSAKNDDKKKDDEGNNWESIINTFLGGGDDDEIMTKIYNCFEKIMASGCGTIEGKTINSHIFMKLSMDDLEKLLGEYVLTFLFPSLRS